MSTVAPSASYSLTVRLAIQNRTGMLGRVAMAIGNAGGDIGAVDLVESGRDRIIRDITINARDSVHGMQIVNRLKQLAGVRVVNISDRTFLMHLGGKIEVQSKVPVRTRDDLSMAYTPGVARVSLAIKEDRQRAFSLTIKQNTVAVVTDGTAVLGLGDIGPEAALPVMEGKAMLFKEFANVDAFPICLATKEPDKIVETVKYLAPGFGGINLEDIAAPRCFEIEERLRKELDIPVFHDDQHGTAVVVLAALLNALRIVKKDLKKLRVVVTGVGAAGTATIKILLSSGVRDIIGVDEHGTIYRGRAQGMDFMKRWVAGATNPRQVKGRLADALARADVFIGLSVPGILTVRDLKRMARDPIVFAMANPVPEIQPEQAQDHVRVMATGRSDYPNQINNVLCFPGFFRGLLDSRARTVNDEMKVAAARALAGCVARSELSEEYIIPSVFNKTVAPAVAEGVARAAARGPAGRPRRLRALPRRRRRHAHHRAEAAGARAAGRRRRGDRLARPLRPGRLGARPTPSRGRRPRLQLARRSAGPARRRRLAVRLQGVPGLRRPTAVPRAADARPRLRRRAPAARPGRRRPGGGGGRQLGRPGGQQGGRAEDEPRHARADPERAPARRRRAMTLARRVAEIEPFLAVEVAERAPAMQLLFGALLDPGDEVVLSDPYYACYPNFIKYAEGVPVTVDTTEEDGFQYRPEDIARRLGARTRAILVNSPANPTGAVLSAE